jgi:hypothetical protein
MGLFTHDEFRSMRIANIDWNPSLTKGAFISGPGRKEYFI